MNESLKYKRGTVWWFHDKDSIDPEDHVQRGNRPVLVVSNDEGNSTNPTLICLAITTKVEKKKKTINVIIKNDKDEDNTVLCNQFKTVNKSQLTKYVYTLSDKDMKRVEEGMITALQLNYLMDALLCTYSIDQLNSIIEGIIIKKFEELQSKPKDNIMSASEVFSKKHSISPAVSVIVYSRSRLRDPSGNFLIIDFGTVKSKNLDEPVLWMLEI